jgi:hypothetical protein
MTFLSANLVSWSSKRHNVVSYSSAEAEYGVMANGVAEACWLWHLPHELQTLLMKSTLIYCNSVSTVYLSTNPIQHKRMKYVEIDLHFVQEHVAIDDIRILHVRMTSSRRVCLLLCSRSFGPVSMFAVAIVLTAGGGC